MKRIILLASLLLAVSACSPAPAPSNANTPTPAANTSNASTPSTATTPSDSGVTAKEKEIWDNIKAKNPDAFAAMLAEDFIYVSSDGVHDKAASVNGIKQIEATDITLSDWKTVTVNKDAAIVTYTANMKGTSGGQPIPPGAMRAGSLWVNRGGKWVGVFHQDTPVEERPAGDDAANKPAAQSTPAAESKPAEPVSDDPVAREKQVWDAIKKKDFDRFASFLAEDQLEVAPWGVNDKAASVSGVQQADFSRAALSDFKMAKISDDVAIVTYMIKGVGGMSSSGARASTIWVKRDGKWLAIYHQDTTVTPTTANKK
jgi:hypothetical protein